MSYTVRFEDGDFAIDSTGGQELITGSEKAAQDTLHVLLLPYDSAIDDGNEMFDPDGSLTSIVGNEHVGAQALRTFLRSALRRLQRAQQQDATTSRAELITKVKSLVVAPLNNDVTAYGFFLSIVVDDINMAIARSVSMRHLGDTNRPLLGGFDP